MRNLLIFGFFVIALIMVQFAQAQTADEIIAKYLTALGGKEKLLTLNNVRMQGSMSIQGNDVSVTTTKQHLVALRTEIEVAGTSNYQLVTASKGMVFMPVQGMTAPEEMPEAQFKNGQTQLDIQSVFLNYKEKGSTVELLGSEKLDGEDNFKVKVSFTNGLVTTYLSGLKITGSIKPPENA